MLEEDALSPIGTDRFSCWNTFLNKSRVYNKAFGNINTKIGRELNWRTKTKTDFKNIFLKKPYCIIRKYEN